VPHEQILRTSDELVQDTDFSRCRPVSYDSAQRTDDLSSGLAAVLLATAFPSAAPLGKVKITGFDIHKVSVRWRDLMFVEVHTDAGITGLGSDTREPYRPKRFLQEVARLKAKAVP
jgi:hypothetical protein